MEAAIELSCRLFGSTNNELNLTLRQKELAALPSIEH